MRGKRNLGWCTGLVLGPARSVAWGIAEEFVQRPETRNLWQGRRTMDSGQIGTEFGEGDGKKQRAVKNSTFSLHDDRAFSE